MRKSRFLAGLAALAIGAVSFPASAQTPSPVDVLLENPSGTRVLHVEDLQGNELSKLDFGTSRSLPFRVRVVDDAFDREGFTVEATMTNLYRTNSAGAVDYDLEPIASEKVTLGSASSPSALDVKAVVRPVLNTVTTIASPAICQLLGLTALGSSTGCTINGTDVVGKVTELTATEALLAQLPKLPLVPQPVETGKFLNAEYGAGVGIGQAPEGALDPTALDVLGGDALAVDLSGLTALANDVPDIDLIDAGALLTELGQTLPVSKLLPEQVTALVAATTATVKLLTLDDVLSQTGTYLSLPTLNVDSSDAEPGDYKGTLVITALQ